MYVHSDTQLVPEAPTCEAADDVSGIDACEVSGYSPAVGQHTITFRDNAENEEESPERIAYEVVVG